jgi:hypothetical protein
MDLSIFNWYHFTCSFIKQFQIFDRDNKLLLPLTIWIFIESKNTSNNNKLRPLQILIITCCKCGKCVLILLCKKNYFIPMWTLIFFWETFAARVNEWLWSVILKGLFYACFYHLCNIKNFYSQCESKRIVFLLLISMLFCFVSIEKLEFLAMHIMQFMKKNKDRG